ncbi:MULTISPECIES: molybdopterin-guanine dinucleotide biosynthesis protein B [Deefgea]|uniref:Molybdopterin-guanine dinucleotide biosynthesis protein B n=1 Tax=Deefgea chitinilytica TaxID=570276 RepID=A0ABS2CE80_9NEIS|nr:MULTISPECIES: molybdopterin-guanine dinucleotide biosynthesis protein B [Deefgea]MBM5571701.1 molybdopterin-guanine dinucleotide biosynthesis protein B [Deefgea chitinilytica]MBM9888936.1 molybdopterin-guanine dinucleotide biosynthesis protein B [Deefgea sp. CFH1-16]
MLKKSPHILAITGYSGSGKTTLIEALLPELAQLGWRVNVIKHSHHDLELEPPRKDSARFRAAGAGEVMVVSPFRYAIVHELRGAAEPTLAEQIARLAPADLTLLEGFKSAEIPKIEIWREANGKPLLYPIDASIIAIATDSNEQQAIPVLNLNDIPALARFIFDLFAKKP